MIMYAGGGLGSGDEGPATEAGVFKSVDSGNTWIPTNQGLLDTTVDALWIDQSNPNVLLAGSEYGGLFRTSDAGQSWTQVSPDAPVSAIVSSNGGILAGTGADLEFSGDGGETWNILQRTPSVVRCIAASGSDTIAGEENGDVLWKGPTDQSWVKVASNPQYPIFEVAIDPIDSSVGYYGRGCCGTSNDLVYHTGNRGASWNLINPPINGFSQALAVRPSDRAILVAGQSMFYSSTDFGTTWKTLTAPWDSRKIFVLPNATSLVIGSDHGLHWTDDGGQSWRDLTSSISSNIIYNVAVSGQTILTASQDFGPFISSDGGKTWGTPTGQLTEGGGVAINPGNPFSATPSCSRVSRFLRMVAGHFRW